MSENEWKVRPMLKLVDLVTKNGSRRTDYPSASMWVTYRKSDNLNMIHSVVKSMYNMRRYCKSGF